MSERAILLNERDAVATALTDLSQGEQVSVTLGARTVEVTLKADIPFGHKYAVEPIGKGQDILKYGLSIGKALNDIEPGDWVHVHNCRSERFGFQHERYGINA